jgi:hypothetical protein
MMFGVLVMHKKQAGHETAHLPIRRELFHFYAALFFVDNGSKFLQFWLIHFSFFLPVISWYVIKNIHFVLNGKFTLHIGACYENSGLYY